MGLFSSRIRAAIITLPTSDGALLKVQIINEHLWGQVIVQLLIMCRTWRTVDRHGLMCKLLGCQYSHKLDAEGQLATFIWPRRSIICLDWNFVVTPLIGIWLHGCRGDELKHGVLLQVLLLTNSSFDWINFWRFDFWPIAEASILLTINNFGTLLCHKWDLEEPIYLEEKNDSLKLWYLNITLTSPLSMGAIDVCF